MDYQNITDRLISELDEPVAKVITHLLEQIDSLKSAINKQNLAIVDLNNEVRDLKERVLSHERYTSKDYFIFNNFPVNGNYPNLQIYQNTCVGRSQNTSNITYPPKTSYQPLYTPIRNPSATIIVNLNKFRTRMRFTQEEKNSLAKFTTANPFLWMNDFPKKKWNYNVNVVI